MPKAKPNGFSLYMKDLLKEFNAGRTSDFYTLATMSKEASPRWNALTDDERERYNARAKILKNQQNGPGRPGKLTSDGIPLAHLEAAEREEQKRKMQMASDVRSFVHENDTDDGGIIHTNLYIISFNISTATREGIYIPNEVGLIQYSIHDGLKNSFHKFIDPGLIPLGYSSDAKAHSEATHKIPVMEFDQADDDYPTILANILDLIEARKKRVIIYSHGDQLEQNQACYQWLKYAANFTGTDYVMFADIALVLTEMLQLTDQSPAKVTIEDMLRHNGFDYAEDTRCGFHEDLDNSFCALGYSRKLCFILSDNLLKPFEVEMTSKHLPERVSDYACKSWEPKGPLKPVINKINVPPKPILPHQNKTIVKNIRSSSYVYEEQPLVVHSYSAIPPPSTPIFQGEEDDFPPLSALDLNSKHNIPVARAGSAWNSAPKVPVARTVSAWNSSSNVPVAQGASAGNSSVNIPVSPAPAPLDPLRKPFTTPQMLGKGIGRGRGKIPVK